MGQVVYDNLSYYVSYDKDVFEEGYDGFIVEENYNGTYFVVYKKIEKDGESERRFVLPDKTLSSFLNLKKKIDGYFKQQKVLLKMMDEALTLYVCGGKESLRDICNKYYESPMNYLKFVALNITKSKFYFFVNERYEGNKH